jgi:hypothetical protein
VRRGKGSLFNLGEIVLGVLVEYELPNRAKRVFSMRPDFGKVEDVVAEILSLLRGHGLDIHGPGGEFASLDSFEKSLGRVVWVLSS